MVSLKGHNSKLNRNYLGGHLTLIAYKSFFIFNQQLYRETDSIAKFFPLGQDFLLTFHVILKNKSFWNVHLMFYSKFLEDMLLVCKSNCFYLSTKHLNITFRSEF